MTVSHDIINKETSSFRRHWDKIYSAYYWLTSEEAEENTSTAYITKNHSDMFINDICEYVGKKVDSVSCSYGTAAAMALYAFSVRYVKNN